MTLSTTTRLPVLADHLHTAGLSPAIRNVTLAVGGSLALALSAQVSIPMVPVPVTLQSLAVLVIGMGFGRRLATATVLLYLLEGAMGLPVFANRGAGAATLLGPTGGYLGGFVVAAWVMGWLAERGWDRRLLTTLAAQTIGTILILACGVLWLSRYIGFNEAIAKGFTPFLVGGVLKIAIATIALPTVWRLVRNKQSERPNPKH